MCDERNDLVHDPGMEVEMIQHCAECDKQYAREGKRGWPYCTGCFGAFFLRLVR